jgi:hypothetical protein
VMVKAGLALREVVAGGDPRPHLFLCATTRRNVSRK